MLQQVLASWLNSLRVKACPSLGLVRFLMCWGVMCCREEKGKSIMQVQHTAIMVEPDEAASCTPCSSSVTAGHSRSYRPPSGTQVALYSRACNRHFPAGAWR